MYGLFTILLCLLTITMHELGHAWAMRRCGIPIREISLLGVPVPYLPSLTFWYRFKGQHLLTKIGVHAFVIGAYVQPDKHALKLASVKDRAFIYGAGPLINFVYAGLVLMILDVTSRSHTDQMLHTVVYGVCVAAMLLFAKFTSRYVVPVVGILLFGFLLYSLATSATSFIEGIGGPITISREGTKMYAEGVVANNELRTAFYLSGVLSFLLGTTNALPFVPLDGGHIVRAYLGAWHEQTTRYFTYGSITLFLAFIGTAIFNDLAILFSYLFTQVVGLFS